MDDGENEIFLTIMGYGPDGGGEHGRGEWVDLLTTKSDRSVC